MIYEYDASMVLALTLIISARLAIMMLPLRQNYSPLPLDRMHSV